MNTFKAVHTEYLRPSRTIETVLVSNENLSQVFFIYNSSKVLLVNNKIMLNLASAL